MKVFPKNNFRVVGRIFDGHSVYQKMGFLFIGFSAGALAASPLFPSPPFVYQYQTLISGFVALAAALFALHASSIDRAAGEYLQEAAIRNELERDLSDPKAREVFAKNIFEIAKRLSAMPHTATNHLYDLAHVVRILQLAEQVSRGRFDAEIEELDLVIAKDLTHFRVWLTECRRSRRYLDFEQGIEFSDLFKKTISLLAKILQQNHEEAQ